MAGGAEQARRTVAGTHLPRLTLLLSALPGNFLHAFYCFYSHRVCTSAAHKEYMGLHAPPIIVLFSRQGTLSSHFVHPSVSGCTHLTDGSASGGR